MIQHRVGPFGRSQFGLDCFCVIAEKDVSKLLGGITEHKYVGFYLLIARQFLIVLAEL